MLSLATKQLKMRFWSSYARTLVPDEQSKPMEAILPDPLFEILNPMARATDARVALFDFDGTLSLLRAGWANVMVPMMVEELAGPNSGESEAELESVVREFVDRLTGKQTVYQMIELARQV